MSILSVFCAASALLAQPTPPPATVPAASGAPRLAHGHPCTLWDDQDVTAYKASLTTNTAFKAAFAELKAWGDQRIAEPLRVPEHQVEADGMWTFPAFKRGCQAVAGKWNWEWHFNTALQQRTADVSNLGALYAITGDGRYADFARRILLALADAYGHGKGSAVPDPHGYDHFEAYGFGGGVRADHRRRSHVAPRRGPVRLPGQGDEEVLRCRNRGGGDWPDLEVACSSWSRGVPVRFPPLPGIALLAGARQAQTGIHVGD